MSEKEKIVCAAIQYNAWDICQEKYRDEPFYICGLDYESIMESDAYVQCCILKSTINDKKGFITNKDRFVDPREAMKIAIDAGQIPYLKDLFDSYHHARINNPDTGVSYEAKMLFSAFNHQRSIWECRDLKPEDLY